jgi:hypothetical protein
MKTFVNVLKVFSVAALLTSCAYEKDPGLLPKVGDQTIDKLAGKPALDVINAKYKTLSAVCTLTAKPAPPAPPVTPDPKPPVPVDPSQPTPPKDPSAPTPAPADPSNPAPAPAPVDPAPAPVDPGPQPAPPPADIISKITEGAGPLSAPPAEQQRSGEILTPLKDKANEKVTINFAAQAEKTKALSEIKDAVMTITLPAASVESADAAAGVKVTANLTVAPLTFKEADTQIDKNSIVVSKHSPRMSAKAVITTDKDAPGAAPETLDINLSEGINTTVESKSGTLISCDFAGTLDEKDELLKGQLLIVDCAAKESDLTDKDAKAVWKLNCENGKPKPKPKDANPPAPNQPLS